VESKKLTIWTNAKLPTEAAEHLASHVLPHRLLFARESSPLNLVASPPDSLLAEADVAFGQPDADQIRQLPNLRWIHLTSAGYTPYDRDDLRSELRARNAPLTTSSGVYDEPCSQHVLAMMLSFARQLPQSYATQLSDCTWPAAERRRHSFLLNGQTAIICGFGEIANRLCELLAPFRMKLIGTRRNVRGDEPIQLIDPSQLADILPLADHVINVLPANASTRDYFDSDKFFAMKRGTYFYNIGRGGTVDQEALRLALESGRLAGAYLDVMTPEPLLPDHPLWRTPNCYLTPHTAGGFDFEMMGLVEHFLANLDRFTSNSELLNRVI
jgi:phosphoglycerate dehydrogenase-like enzyme